MRRTALIGVGCGFIIGLLIVQSGGRLFSSRPVLVPEANALNIEHLTGKDTSVNLRLHNRGNVALQIHKVYATCSCSAVDIDRALVPPGQYATLQVAITRSMVSRPGYLATVTIESNDTRTPVLQIPVTIGSVAGITVTPSVVDFGKVRRDLLPVSRVVYVATDSQSAGQDSPLICDSDAPWVEITQSKYDSERREFIVLLALNEPIDAGQLKTKIRFSSSKIESRDVEKEISVLALIVDD